MASSDDSTIAARRAPLRSETFHPEISRAIFETPMTDPSSRIAEAVTTTSIGDPFL
jgi:hypothetical protein